MRTKPIRKAVPKEKRYDAMLSNVISSNVIAMGHNGKDEMIVLYKAGIPTKEAYVFKGVSETLYLGIRHAPSIGKALHAAKLEGSKIRLDQ